jgi:hypothetical protein
MDHFDSSESIAIASDVPGITPIASIPASADGGSGGGLGCIVA